MDADKNDMTLLEELRRDQQQPFTEDAARLYIEYISALIETEIKKEWARNDKVFAAISIIIETKSDFLVQFGKINDSRAFVQHCILKACNTPRFRGFKLSVGIQNVGGNVHWVIEIKLE